MRDRTAKRISLPESVWDNSLMAVTEMPKLGIYQLTIRLSYNKLSLHKLLLFITAIKQLRGNQIDLKYTISAHKWE